MSYGGGLPYSYHQNQENEQDTKPAKSPKAPAFEQSGEEKSGKPQDKSFVQSNPNPNLYNTENDKPVDMTDESYTEPGSNRVAIDLQRLEHTKVGNKVHYSKGVGTIVKKQGMYVTILNEDGEHYDQAHIAETYLPGDKISMGVMNQLWDKMSMEARVGLLHKAKIPAEFYESRTWFELPRQVTDIIKDVYSEPSHGGFAGREPGVSRDDESRSMYGADKPVDDKDEGKSKSEEMSKSDVEHGMYGGIDTSMEPLEATEDYEEDDRTGDREQQRHTHAPNRIHEAGRIEMGKDPTGNSTVLQKTSCASCGSEEHATDEHDIQKEDGGDGGVSTSTEGVNNPVYGGDDKKPKDEPKEKGTRYAIRYGINKADYEAFIAKRLT